MVALNPFTYFGQIDLDIDSFIHVMKPVIG